MSANAVDEEISCLIVWNNQMKYQMNRWIEEVNVHELLAIYQEVRGEKEKKHELIQGVRKMRAEINKLCVTKLHTNIDERNPRRREYDNDKFNVTYRYIEGHKKVMKCHSVRFAI